MQEWWSFVVDSGCRRRSYPSRTAEQSYLGEALLSSLSWGRVENRIPKHCTPHTDLPDSRSWNVMLLCCKKNRRKQVKPSNSIMERSNSLWLQWLVWATTCTYCQGARKYNIDIAAPSETHFSDESQLEEVGAGCIFFDLEILNRKAAVRGWICHQNINCEKLDAIPKGINDRQMVLRLKLANERHATIISSYAPSDNLEWCQRSYEDLGKVVRSVLRSEKLILLRTSMLE